MARDFNGTSQRLRVASAVLTGVPISMACWAYARNDTTNHVLMSITDKDVDNQSFTVQLSGAIAGDPARALTQQGTSAIAATTTGYAANTWQHVLGVFAASNDRRVYLNGGGKGTDNTALTPAGLDRTAIGVNDRLNPTGFSDALIGEATIWSVALTDDDAVALAAGFNPLQVAPESIVAYWSIFGVDSPEPDWTTAFDMTLINAPTFAEHAPVLDTGRYSAHGIRAALVAAATSFPSRNRSHPLPAAIMAR